MALLICSIVLLLVAVQVAFCCRCLPQNNTMRICRADFVGTVLLKSRQSDAENMRYIYNSEYATIFRANFDIPTGNNETTLKTYQQSATCGISLTVRNDTTANVFFMAAAQEDGSLSANTCSSLVCRWKDLGDVYHQNLSKSYVDSACACKWDDKTCTEKYNFDFVECSNVD